MKLSISTMGIDEVARNIRELSQTGGGVHSKRLWGKIGRALRADSMRCFKNQRTPDGTPWAPLNESTLRAKIYKRMEKHRRGLKKKRGYQSKIIQRMMGKDKILMDTGKLRASITTEHTDRSVKVGSRMVYARTHQEGDPKRNIPARPFLGVSESGLKIILDTVRTHVAKQAEKAGG